MSKTLFILKRRPDFNSAVHTKIGLTTGLYNSANFMNEMLQANGIESKLVVAVDNNEIDREVTQYRPTHVIVEALWVVPTKFAVLQKLHPNVTWVIRLHSEMPFLASEGIAMDWIGDYSMFRNVVIAANAPRMLREMRFYLKHRNGWTDEQVDEKLIYLPNYYPQDYLMPKVLDRDKDTIDISCFGAIRPLKNHMVQAFAAMEFATMIGKKLRFHVNAGRIEMKGDPVINNLKGLFEQVSHTDCQLVNHMWRTREGFLELCGQMDLGMQVSFSETFNIVAADLISQGVPVVGCDEIPWFSLEYCADPTNSADIINKMVKAYESPEINVSLNQTKLTHYTNQTRDLWYQYFKD